MQTGFSVEWHHLEFFGLRPECSLNEFHADVNLTDISISQIAVQGSLSIAVGSDDQ